MELDVRALVGAMEAQDVDATTAMLTRCATAEQSAAKALRRAHDQYGTPLMALAIHLNEPALLDALLNCGLACQDKQPEDNDDEDEDDDEDEVEDEDEDVYPVCSPLCEAVRLGHDDCARVLIAHGASVDAPSWADGTEYTSIHMGALYGGRSPFFREQVLASSHAVDARGLADFTPLYLAVVNEARDGMQCLVAAGADPRSTVPDSGTLMHVAITYKLTQCAAWLLDDCVVDVDARDALGNTPLLGATFVGQFRMQYTMHSNPPENHIIEILLDHGADVDATNHDGNTAVFGAVWNGFTDAILVLLARGASVRASNLRGEKVLHVAARSQAVLPTTAWEALLRAGADVDARDGDGRTFQEIWISRDKDPEELEEIWTLVERLRGAVQRRVDSREQQRIAT